MLGRVVGAAVTALVAVAAAVAVTVTVVVWTPELISGEEFGEVFEVLAVGVVLVGLMWGTFALPAVTWFLAWLAWVGEVRALRRGGRPAPGIAVWSLHDLDGLITGEPGDGHGEQGYRIEVCRDGDRVAVVVVCVQARGNFLAGARVHGSGRELRFVGEPRKRAAVIQDDRGRVVGRIVLVYRVWYGYHRVEIGCRRLLAPVGRLRGSWRAADDSGAIRAVRFAGPPDAVVTAELAADLEPAALGAALWYLRCDRAHAVVNNNSPG